MRYRSYPTINSGKNSYPRRNGFRSRLLYISLALNFLLLAGALGLAFQFREKLLQLYLAWRGKADIVFFGDSITAQGQWNSLLGRCDIKNSGIPGLGVCHLKDEVGDKVLKYSPGVCVVMGGINDLTILERTAVQATDDYRALLNRLAAADVKTVVQLTLYERQSPATRLKIDSLNRWLASYCDSLGITTVDPNAWLSDHTGLQKGFAGDRTHLTAEAYEKWAEELRPLLSSWL